MRVDSEEEYSNLRLKVSIFKNELQVKENQ